MYDRTASSPKSFPRPSKLPWITVKCSRENLEPGCLPCDRVTLVVQLLDLLTNLRLLWTTHHQISPSPCCLSRSQQLMTGLTGPPACCPPARRRNRGIPEGPGSQQTDPDTNADPGGDPSASLYPGCGGDLIHHHASLEPLRSTDEMMSKFCRSTAVRSRIIHTDRYFCWNTGSVLSFYRKAGTFWKEKK